MRVETAPDIKPRYLSKLYGFVNLTPNPADFDVKVLSARDHVVRNRGFQDARVVVENACIDFCGELGQQLESKIVEALSNSTAGPGPCQIVSGVANNSRFFEMLTDIHASYDHLFLDIAGTLHDIVAEADCPTELRDAILHFVSRHAPKGAVAPSTLLPSLKALQENGEQEYLKSKESTTREPLEWNPRVAKLFFERIGPYLPVPIERRESVKGGRFQVQRALLPLSVLRSVDPSATTPLKILIQGRSEDYFSRNTTVRTAVVPSQESTIIMLGIVSRFHKADYPLEFVSFKKPLFTDLALKEEWEPLIELFRLIVSGQHTADYASWTVDAMGYVSNLPPLLVRGTESGRGLVINGYNELSKDIQRTYLQALA
jgi:hypothetical protein